MNISYGKAGGMLRYMEHRHQLVCVLQMKDEKNMEKLIKDGCVAVLVSHGYGAGWSTWENDERMIFDPVLAEMLEREVVDGSIDVSEELEIVAKQRYPEAYLGGLDGLAVHWVPIGSRFRIEEYDGAESIVFENEYRWSVA